MTTMIQQTTIQNIKGFDRRATPLSCPTSMEVAAEIALAPEFPISTGSPLYKFATVISRLVESIFGPVSPDSLEKDGDDYSYTWPCCS